MKYLSITLLTGGHYLCVARRVYFYGHYKERGSWLIEVCVRIERADNFMAPGDCYTPLYYALIVEPSGARVIN